MDRISRRSQTSMEFVLIISLFLFVMMIAIYLISDVLFVSHDDIRLTQMNGVGQNVVDEARDVHYLGLFSQEIMSVNMPEGIVQMRSITFMTAEEEHYLVAMIEAKGERFNLTFPSEVPLLTGSCNEYFCTGTTVCRVCEFQPDLYSAGRKDIRLESVIKDGVYAVNISRTQI
jgi:hypothetical protein